MSSKSHRLPKLMKRVYDWLQAHPESFTLTHSEVSLELAQEGIKVSSKTVYRLRRHMKSTVIPTMDSPHTPVKRGAELEGMTYSEFEEYRDNLNLLPVRDMAEIVPICCAFCRDFAYVDGYSVCGRPGGFSRDVGDRYEFSHVCMRFSLPKRTQENGNH